MFMAKSVSIRWIAATISLFIAVISSASTVNTRLKPVPLANGVLVVKMIGQWNNQPTDTFRMTKQVFTGSTNCSTGAGTATMVSGLSWSVGDSISLGASDSVLLSPLPSSDKNGPYLGFQNPDGATLSYLPGNVVCVAGFLNATKNVQAQYAPAVQVLDATCSAPKYYTRSGETVCVRVAGTAASGGAPWHLMFSGGLPNTCNLFPSAPQTNVPGESGTYLITMPANNATIPAGCNSGSSTTDIRGIWQAYLYDFTNNYRAGDQFRLHDSNAFADLSIYGQANDPNGSGGFPPAGTIKYSWSVQNSGPDGASNVSFVMAVPSGTTFSSYKQTLGLPFTCTGPAGLNITCTTPYMPADTYASFDMFVSYSGKANNTLITSTASVTSSAADPYLVNNTNSASNPAPVAQVTTNTNVGQFICRPDMTATSVDATGVNVIYNTYYGTAPGYFTTTATYTGGYFAATPASGTKFPIGTTSLTVNSNAGSGQCTFNVKVLDGQRPDLTVTSSHLPAIMGRGETGVQFFIGVGNSGGLSTIGAVSVKATLPQGLLPTSISGTGWTCSLNTVTCSRADALVSNGNYPQIVITANVPRYFVVSGPVTSNVTVSGGGEGITTNDSIDEYLSITNPFITAQPKGDTNLDGFSDIAWRNSATGQTSVWLMYGASPYPSSTLTNLQFANNAFTFAGTGDFNGDGKADFIWRNNTTGDTFVWMMDGTNAVAGSGQLATVPSPWVIAGVGDFNGDGKSDLLWRNGATGVNTIWLLNGVSVLGGSGSINTIADVNWHPGGIGDFNGDGRSDILWRNDVTGASSLWMMNGLTIQSDSGSTNLQIGTAWRAAGVGDFNGDGYSDIMWRNTATGDNIMWLMNGVNAISGSGNMPAVPDVTWNVVAVGDYNSDQHDDIIWRNDTTGATSIWMLNGSTFAPGSGVLGTIPAPWQVVGPR
jgi:uncharacterized repeat protein (TIGR01451 family)